MVINMLYLLLLIRISALLRSAIQLALIFLGLCHTRSVALRKVAKQKRRVCHSGISWWLCSNAVLRGTSKE